MSAKRNENTMRYGNIKKAEFVVRKNRFICDISIDGNIEKCHVKNTGRLGELLVPGAEIYVTVSDNPERKTKYDLVTVVKDGKYVNIDSFAPNLAVGEYLHMIYPEANVIPERKYGNSRFDFYVENGNEKLFIEVKGVTLFRDGRALFPDAPTERGIKHLSELAKCIEEGYIPKVFFVIASDFDGNIVFSPNREIENEFANALKKASDNGVEICAFECLTEADSLYIKKQVSVVLD